MAEGKETHHFWNPAAASASGGKSLAFKSAVVLTTSFTALAVVSLIVEPLYGDYLVDAWPCWYVMFSVEPGLAVSHGS